MPFLYMFCIIFIHFFWGSWLVALYNSSPIQSLAISQSAANCNCPLLSLSRSVQQRVLSVVRRTIPRNKAAAAVHSTQSIGPTKKFPAP